MNPPRKTSSSRSSSAPEKEPGGLVIDYSHLARLCLRYWKWLAGGVLLGAVVGLLVALAQTTIYSAHATIEVAPKDRSSLPVANVTTSDHSLDMMKTMEQLLQTRDLAQRVVRNEKLNLNPEFLPKGVSAPVSEDYAVSVLAQATDIHLRPLTRLIDVTIEHRSPEIAKFLADKIAQESIVRASDQNGNTASVLSASLQREVDDLRAKGQDAATKLVEYQRTHHMNGTPDPGSDLEASQVQDLNKRYIDAQAQLTLLNERYGPNHPKLIQQKQTVDELHAQLSKAQTGQLNQNGATVEYTSLKQAADSYKSQLASMEKALLDANAAITVTDPGITVAELAELPLAPVRPSKTKNVAIGGFLGVLGGACFILGLYFMDASIRTVSQAENLLNVPVIAAVPILPESESLSKLPTFTDPQSFVAESFRGLRASLLLHDREHPLKTVLVGSAIPGEGKSFCASNLAVAFAQAGLKTLLIDADLRLPTGYQYFGIEGDGRSNGFPDVLAGRATLASAVIKSKIPTLDLLMTLTAADSPAELLSGPQLHEMLDEAATKYDRIVIDSAPLNAVSDTMLIVQRADAILLVVRAGQTPASESKSALQKIYNSKMKPLGLILNYLAPHTLKSYRYGYSYGQKPPKESHVK